MTIFADGVAEAVHWCGPAVRQLIPEGLMVKEAVISSQVLWLDFRSSGSRISFKRLFDACYEQSCIYANVFLHSREDAEEIVLDLFLYLWRNRESIDIRGSFEHYLRTSVRNRSLNHLRRHVDLVDIDELDPNYFWSVDSGVDLEDINTVVWDAVSSLCPKCREAFRLSREEGMANADIAERMGLSSKSVEAYITKALKAVRISLKKNFFILLFFGL